MSDRPGGFAADDPRVALLDAVLAEVRAESLRAWNKFAPFNSPHEGYAVIKEELDELWDEVKANRGRFPEGAREAMQTAAMAVRYMVDVAPEAVRHALIQARRDPTA